MKNLTIFILVATISIGFQACKRSDNNTENIGDHIKLSTDTTLVDYETRAVIVDSIEVKFIKNTINDGLAEVASAKFAMEKTNSAKIKALAAMVIFDNNKLNYELLNIAKIKKMDQKTGLDTYHQLQIDEMDKLSGRGFDFAYLNAVTESYGKTIDLLQNEAENSNDKTLKSFAKETLTIFEKRLQEINKIQVSVK